MYAPKAQKTGGNQHSTKGMPNWQENQPADGQQIRKIKIADRLYVV